MLCIVYQVLLFVLFLGFTAQHVESWFLTQGSNPGPWGEEHPNHWTAQRIPQLKKVNLKNTCMLAEWERSTLLIAWRLGYHVIELDIEYNIVGSLNVCVSITNSTSSYHWLTCVLHLQHSSSSRPFPCF